MVGAPCGIMDQMTSALGKSSHLLVRGPAYSHLLGLSPIPPPFSAVTFVPSAMSHGRVTARLSCSVSSASRPRFKVFFRFHSTWLSGDLTGASSACVHSSFCYTATR